MRHVGGQRQLGITCTSEVLVLDPTRKEVDVASVRQQRSPNAWATRKDQVCPSQEFALLVDEAREWKLEGGKVVHDVIHDQVGPKEVDEASGHGRVQPRDQRSVEAAPVCQVRGELTLQVGERRTLKQEAAVMQVAGQIESGRAECCYLRVQPPAEGLEVAAVDQPRNSQAWTRLLDFETLTGWADGDARFFHPEHAVHTSHTRQEVLRALPDPVPPQV